MLWLSLLALAAVLFTGMGIFGSGDKTNTTNQEDQRIAASDQAIANRGAQSLGTGDQSAQGLTNSNAIGPGGHQAYASTVQEGGGLLVTGGGKVGDIITNSADPAVITAFGTTLRDVLGTQSAASQAQSTTLADIVKSQGDQSSQLFNDIGSKIADLSKNQTTGGETDRNKIILYIVLGVLALFGFVAWTRR